LKQNKRKWKIFYSKNKERKKMEIYCYDCEKEILDERDAYNIEPMEFYLCEICMAKYQEGPQDDLMDDLADDLNKL
jgi:peptide subunit release factor 1 (eRF1)